MNINEYIESGILELYVLGGLSAEEQAEVATLVAQHPELEAEVISIEANLMQVGESNAPKELNLSILENALSKIEENKSDKKESNVVSINKTSAKNELQTTNEVPKSNFLRIATIAASIALLFSLGFNYKLWTNVKEAQNQIADLRNQNSVFAEDLKVQTTKYDATQNQLATLSNPNTLKVSLKGIEGKENALATVYWNTESKQTYINVNNLPEAPEGMQYQLWALADGVPIDAGVFDVNNEIQVTKAIENAQTFAVTLEEAGGKPSPNLEQLYVIGNV